MGEIKLGSLFDGSGGFPLAACLCGITPVWASEIEPYPIAVTRSRFPAMKHLGNISTINGAEIEPVDVITFGSPCQDMSIAGRRDGLDGSRSSLFYEAVRIIKEMRCATNDRYPRYIIWENVPGAFSSNKGEDFKAVLEAVIGIIEPNAEVPMPEKARWPYADLYMGDGWSVAYRTLDAQYWGVPQRRHRIYLVADLAGGSAGKILFEREGLRGHFTEGTTPWETVAGSSPAGIGTTGLCLNDQGGSYMDVSEDVTATLRAEAHHPPCVMESAGFCTEHSANARSIGYEEECAPTLRAGVVPAAVALENHPTDSRVKLSEDGNVQTLTSRMGTGGNNVPLVMRIRSGCEGGCKGPLLQENKSATLSCSNDQMLFEPRAFGICSKDSNAMKSDNPHSGITADKHVVYVMTISNFTQVEEDASPTIMARDYKDPNAVCMGHGYTVRRLTPTECARLQGFPDTWGEIERKSEIEDNEYLFWLDVRNTHAAINGKAIKNYTREQMLAWYNKLHTDSSEYKMWGNGIALPTALYVMQGIEDCLNKEFREPTKKEKNQ